ncbi:ATP-dependent Clp protease ATP-binding subunit ClpX [bacterium]|nr:ATP-dependent Clp protease ATP-binding subunit ClpX [bacterium]
MSTNNTKNIDDKFTKCAFCGKSKKDVALLFKGETASICNECAEEIFYLNFSITNELTNNNELYTELQETIKEESKLTNNIEETSQFKPIIKTPREIKDYLDQYIIGQDDAKEKLSIASYNHYKRINQKISDDVEIEKSNILIVGNSGVGKTLLVKTLSNLLDVPAIIADCTSLTEAGYVGDDVESIITRLLQACDYDVEKAEKGIICLDELDKLARKGGNHSITRDVSGEGVQQGLLKIIEGTTVHVSPKIGRKHPDAPTIEVNTKNILFICAGAFEGLDNIIKSRKNSVSVGFNTQNKVQIDKDINPLKYLNTEDLHRFGLMPELLGRLPIITYLNDLSKDDLIRILTEPKNAIIKQYKKLFKYDDIRLRIDNDVYEYIAECAIKSKLGARGLRTIIETLLSESMFKYPGTNRKNIHITLKYAKEQLSEYIENE